MFTYIAFLDEALAAIQHEVAAHKPERGGALLGPVGQPIVSRFLFDPDARTSGTTYQPSRSLQQRVSDIEKGDPFIELKGILHSHPGDMRTPSSGDLRAFADSLKGAPWLGRFVTPIVTRSQAKSDHELMLKSGVMSVYVAEQGHDGIDLRLGQPHVIPLAADLERLATRVGGRVGPTTLVDIEGCVYIGSSINAPDFELQVLVGAGYPFSAPIVLLTTVSVAGTARTASSPLAQAGTAGATVSLPLTWDLAVADEDRIAIAMRPHLEPVARVEAARDGIGARLVGVTSQSLRSKRVVLVGAGSGGSMTADMLVRSGVERFVVIDPDYVDPANLSRSVYTAADVGKLKVEALRGHLLAVNPQAVCEVVPSALSEIRTTELADLVAGSDLVVAATDDPSAQRLVNHLAYAKGIPSLYAGVYARGHAGEVVFVVPEITRCYRCVTASRHSLSDMEQSTDYGTGRLTAEPALGADILHVVTASVKLALGLLEIEEETAARDFLFGALSAGHSYLILSMVPDYSFFPKVFKEVPNQYAYQSAWLSATGDPECPVCGSDRIDPLASPTKAAPRVSQLRPVELAAQPSTARRGRGGRRR